MYTSPAKFYSTDFGGFRVGAIGYTHPHKFIPLHKHDVVIMLLCKLTFKVYFKNRADIGAKPTKQNIFLIPPIQAVVEQLFIEKTFMYPQLLRK